LVGMLRESDRLDIGGRPPMSVTAGRRERALRTRTCRLSERLAAGNQPLPARSEQCQGVTHWMRGPIADRKDVRPSELPFPWPNGTDLVTTWGPLGSGKFRNFPTALTSGTTMMTAPGSRGAGGRSRVLPGRARYVLLPAEHAGRSVHRDCVIRLKRGLRLPPLATERTPGRARTIRHAIHRLSSANATRQDDAVGFRTRSKPLSWRRSRDRSPSGARAAGGGRELAARSRSDVGPGSSVGRARG